jgi:hypothetical protein
MLTQRLAPSPEGNPAPITPLSAFTLATSVESHSIYPDHAGNIKPDVFKGMLQDRPLSQGEAHYALHFHLQLLVTAVSLAALSGFFPTEAILGFITQLVGVARFQDLLLTTFVDLPGGDQLIASVFNEAVRVLGYHGLSLAGTSFLEAFSLSSALQSSFTTIRMRGEQLQFRRPKPERGTPSRGKPSSDKDSGHGKGSAGKGPSKGSGKKSAPSPRKIGIVRNARSQAISDYLTANFEKVKTRRLCFAFNNAEGCSGSCGFEHKCCVTVCSESHSAYHATASQCPSAPW